MNDAVSLEFIGATLRAIEAEQRTLRGENELIRREVGRVATRDELLAVLRMVTDRIGDSEALMEARFDQSLARLSNPGGA
jgi:hypothetical protein